MLANYLSPDRHYHDIGHIADMLYLLPEMFREYRHQIKYPNELIHAILWHDETYEPTRSGNESMSARQAVRANPLLNPDVLYDIIMATTHEGEPLELIEQQIIADLDLQGLGLDMDQFILNGNDIRKEYHFVSEEEWVKGRCQFFRKMLARPTIYYTNLYYRRYEAKARENMTMAIEMLENGTWPM